MATYPYHDIAGTSLQDATGRWDETPASLVIPTFPGVESSVVTLPGVPGNIPVGLSASMATTIELQLKVWATVGGAIPDTHAERVAAIAANLDALYRAIWGAVSTQSGAVVPLTRHYSATDSRTAYGRVEASATPVMEESANYATISLLFAIPSGTWRGLNATSPTFTASSAIPHLEDSTAPIADSRIVLIGAMSSATVTNGAGNGFKLQLSLAAGQWTVVDTATFTYRAPSTGTPSATATATLTAALSPVGAVSGSALILTPAPSGTTAYVSFTGSTTTDTGFQVRAMPAYF